ncbi:GTPase-associated protein 1-related protein [Streptomyces sp. NPDC047525]|uniref:GTPase-associated protein 1-related protein n=1 Tax=Streptomyces sp. NPDC047525 TaxID=3155264 RepID=UPI00340A7DDA
MAIRRLSYRLDEEPDTGAVRLIPAPAGPQEQEKEQTLESPELTAFVLAVGHRQGLSRSRLPDGAGLLCHTVAGPPGSTPAGHRVDVAYADGTDELPLSLPLGDVAPEGLVVFARAHAPRVEPFLADVRRLFDERAGRQIVIAESAPETVACWVALACASLPDGYAASLTFSTWTAQPRRAPQQILGIGPDADFDRFDGPTLDHFYRVHDGLGGQGSTPIPDPWAEVTARQWIEGTPPEPPCEGDDPFALTRPTLDMRQLAALSDDTRRDVVRAHAAAVAQEDAGSPLVDELYGLCRALGAEDPEAAEPLALALVRHYVAVAEQQGTLPDLAACRRLPLDADAWQRLCGDFGSRADDTLRRGLHQPIGAWTEPLRLVLALGVDAGRGLDKATERLANALLNPGRRACAEAVEVLEALGHTGLNRQVLSLLGGGLTEGKLGKLRDFANSPQGEWLRRRVEAGEAPLVLRLAEAGARFQRQPHCLRGARLFAALVELVPGRKVTDPVTLKRLWRIVWGGKQPDPTDLAELARTCPTRLFVEAGHVVPLAVLLRSPERVDHDLVQFARDLRATGQLTALQRATAELLMTSYEFADGHLSLRTAVERLRVQSEQASPLGAVLKEGTGAWVGRGFALAAPVELCHRPALDFLMSTGQDVLRPYREMFLDEGAWERRFRELPGRPADVAAFYNIWRPRHGHPVTKEWQRVADELLTRVLAPVVPYLDAWTLGEVATEIARQPHGRGSQRVQEWNAWRSRQAGAQGPPRPGSGPGHIPGHGPGHCR